MNTLRFTELNYFSHRDITDPEQVIQLHRVPNAFIHHFPEPTDITLVKHMNYEGSLEKGPVRYRFFKKRNHFFSIPFRTHRFIRHQSPDCVLLSGFIFPLQVIALRLQLGKRPLILIQHQGEQPFTRFPKKLLQRLAARCADGFLFTGKEVAHQWISSGILPEEKIAEILPASSFLAKQDKTASRQLTGMRNQLNFLWVGRLDHNKDPLTVLTAYASFVRTYPDTHLYLVYQTEDLLPQIKNRLLQDPVLQSHVTLTGFVPQEELAAWYSAADYYINASHTEGGSFALIEAMSCGCIPVTSHIPASLKIAGNGTLGFHFPPGDTDALLNALIKAAAADRVALSAAVYDWFQQELPVKKIAGNLYRFIRSLQRK